MNEALTQLTRDRKKAHKRLLDLHSPTYAAFLGMEQAAYADGALPKMAKELIAVGISVVIDCHSCMQWHIEQAVAAGGRRAAGPGSRGGGHRNGRGDRPRSRPGSRWMSWPNCSARKPSGRPAPTNRDHCTRPYFSGHVLI